MIGDLELVSLGLNHKTAPVEIRERLAMGDGQIPQHFQAIKSDQLSSETVILSTCNRVELYAVVHPDDGGDRLTRYLAQAHGLKHRDLTSHLYQFKGSRAVSHLFRVASSLDSMVVGEPQILGQVKTAFSLAREHGAVGRIMHPLMRRTLTVAKRVRTETKIGEASVSVGTAGVDLARQVFGRLDGKRALLLGAGEMGRLVARALLTHGVDELVVANRTYERAVEVARQFGGTAVHLDQVDAYLERVDIAVVSTSARHHVVDVGRMVGVMRARRFKPLFLVDLSVPRNVAPGVHEIEGAYVFNIDDLSQVARQGLERREEQATVAEAIVRKEAERCYESLGARSADPVITRIIQAGESARRAELDRSSGTLDELTPKQREVIDAMTRSMLKRTLHNVIHQARALALASDEDGLRALGDAFEGDDE
ncbi:MAG: glutamyl-tRNA reductase [Proteobacteria bacterium]|nr:glutamyl-tRNA reductase [Pseudomonadota bacterium]MCP4918076.1 glutamyl-tRNA reductase [Pseudomonadota bacterium]